jgi:hypothetical protein
VKARHVVSSTTSDVIVEEDDEDKGGLKRKRGKKVSFTESEETYGEGKAKKGRKVVTSNSATLSQTKAESSNHIHLNFYNTIKIITPNPSFLQSIDMYYAHLDAMMQSDHVEFTKASDSVADKGEGIQMINHHLSKYTLSARSLVSFMRIKPQDSLLVKMDSEPAVGEAVAAGPTSDKKKKTRKVDKTNNISIAATTATAFDPMSKKRHKRVLAKSVKNRRAHRYDILPVLYSENNPDT